MPALRLLALALLSGLLAACSPTAAYNRLALASVGGIQTTRDLPFGPDPRDRLDVYAPKTNGGGLRPVLVFIHGGSWDTGDKSIYPFAGAAFAGRGFVTVVPNYRLVPQVRYPGFIEDNARAVRWARDNARRFGGDPERMVLVGHSAGAYNAAMLALDERWLAEAGLPRGTIKAWAGLAGPYDFLPLDIPSTIATFSGAPDLPATQPINHVDRGDPPALLAAGTEDTTVEPRHTRELAGRLQAVGVPVETHFYPGLGHVGMVTALGPLFRSRAPVLNDVSRFLQAQVAVQSPRS
ncbi:MAG: alpha/beta hydrolase [Proteobacteria bacterium]|nr:alpha/beta hydrolase [Pseudomonadota bacterium]